LKLLEAMFQFFKLIKPAKCSSAKAIEAATYLFANSAYALT
jgi:hypothetical protein